MDPIVSRSEPRKRAFRMMLCNGFEDIRERIRYVTVEADDLAQAKREVWKTPDGNAFFFVHCHLYPRPTASHMPL